MSQHHTIRTLIWQMACDGKGIDDIMAALKKAKTSISRDYVKSLVFECERQRREHQRESQSATASGDAGSGAGSSREVPDRR